MIKEIEIGDEYKIKIETQDKFDKSIFGNLYKDAAINVEAIISQAEYSINEDDKLSSQFRLSAEGYNNIISFTGERGTGKSSSMISFAEALINKEQIITNNYFSKEKYPRIWSNRIASIDVIDPSLFRGDDQLFEIIISKMFAQFQYKLKEKNKEIDHDLKRDLIERFQHVFNNLKVVHKGKKEVYDKEAIEALSDLAYGSNLKSSFKELVGCYLKYVCEGADFLLIAIDDFDLNISGAYEMLEDVRQFLVQSNIIILVACKIEQLTDSIEQRIREEYKTMLPSNNKTYLSENPGDMSSKYLFKLIPANRRCNLPVLKFNDPSLSIVYKGEKLEKGTVENNILSIISSSTGFIFLKRKNYINPLIPRNLREFVSFYNFIASLTESDENSITANRHRFKHYFIKIWCFNNLSKSKYDFICEFDEIESSRKNKSLIQNIKKYFPKVNDDSLKDIQKIENTPLNVCIGDVLTILQFYSRISNTNEINLFLESIRAYYTIELTILFESDKEMAEDIIGFSLYSPATKIFSNIEKNDFWTFSYKEVSYSDSDSPEKKIVNELVSAFIVSMKKDYARTSQDITHEYTAPRDNNDIVFSLLGFLRNFMFYKSHLRRLYPNNGDKFKDRESLLPLFSFDILEEIINDLVNNRAKFKYSEDYASIIYKHLFERISKILTKIDLKYGAYFDNHSFILEMKNQENTVTSFLNSLKNSHDNQFSEEVNDLIEPILMSLSTGNREKLKSISREMIDYYRYRYFDTQDYSGQGAKQAMNNLIKEYNEFDFIQEILYRYRNLMDKNISKGLLGIKSLLQAMSNG